ncbi:hypothetical protein BU24DRAFT_408161 [Aaosphaeria arxii CBS 175.79]|uniref:Protein kinase domain-containing protein n=1 Tax=Aaosphaeria arxii CBS 175.79 TaxID=1450172 RepID=A0A6A5XY40_9PLEO|nr:uncharacterized protein BU24DRAFT_408161 [Aaosphaeria arxii CBS 175.79]KAF2018228.1 hypothetical protein BU24DRAFT_408161 [Aaosphaeria arxii CBS 175.79]
MASSHEGKATATGTKSGGTDQAVPLPEGLREKMKKVLLNIEEQIGFFRQQEINEMFEEKEIRELLASFQDSVDKAASRKKNEVSWMTSRDGNRDLADRYRMLFSYLVYNDQGEHLFELVTEFSEGMPLSDAAKTWLVEKQEEAKPRSLASLIAKLNRSQRLFDVSFLDVAGENDFGPEAVLPYETDPGSKTPVASASTANVYVNTLRGEFCNLFHTVSATTIPGKHKVAVKEMRLTDERKFVRERRFLMMLGKAAQLHDYEKNLINLLESSLSQFWFEHRDSELRNSEDWMISTMIGMTGALSVIHTHRSSGQPVAETHKETLGRHGDIKPDNFLCIKRPGGADGGSEYIVKVADFERNYSDNECRSAVKIDEVETWAPGTGTYQAPEWGDDDLICSKYDIWGLGCVYLEFIIWHLQGWKGIKRFRKGRKGLNEHGIKSDTFYNMNKNSTKPGSEGSKSPEPKESVKFRIKELQTSASPRVESLLKIIGDRMLLPWPPTKRISSTELLSELMKIQGAHVKHTA